MVWGSARVVGTVYDSRGSAWCMLCLGELLLPSGRVDPQGGRIGCLATTVIVMIRVGVHGAVVCVLVPSFAALPVVSGMMRGHAQCG